MENQQQPPEENKRTADPLFCDRCSAALTPGRGNFYVVRIEAIADPTPPEFTGADLQRDVTGDIQQLFAEAEQFSEQELMDQVYRRVVLYLCTPCYRRWIENPAG